MHLPPTLSIPCWIPEGEMKIQIHEQIGIEILPPRPEPMETRPIELAWLLFSLKHHHTWEMMRRKLTKRI